MKLNLCYQHYDKVQIIGQSLDENWLKIDFKKHSILRIEGG